MPDNPPPADTRAEALGDELLRAIAQRGNPRRFPANTVLVTEEDRSDALFIVLEGRVRAYGSTDSGREVVYGTMGPGEYFGELMLDGGPRSASVMTMEPSRLVVVPGAEVRDFLGQHPEFAVHLVRHLIGLVRSITQQAKSLALDDVYGRIARLLRKLAVPLPAGSGEPGAMQLPERLTQQEIADRVGASREMVSRVFKPLVEGGWICLREGRIVLLKKLPERW
jgi:CRP/FNR family transcriptional regulator, cyclic AMP receptor protein